MKGSLVKRGASWSVKYELPRGLDGRRQTRMVVGGRTRKEAQATLTKILSELQAGTYTEPDKQTLAAFLSRWLEDCARSRVGGRTFNRYAELVRLHITPAIGAMPLQALRAPHIQALYTKALKSGRIDGKGGLAPRTVLHIHRILHEALEQAVRWNILSRNPVDAVDPPKVRQVEMKTWDGDQIAAALEAAEGKWIYMPLLLALATGLRAGEICGLQWRDIDLGRGVLTCRRSVASADNRSETPLEFKQPKSGKGRPVSLPATLLEALIRHHDDQVKELDLLGVRSLPGSMESAARLVIADAGGATVRPSILSKRFRFFLDSARLPVIRFHDLRHSHATLLLTAGTNPKVVSERLGHSSIALTLGTYSHVLPAMQEEAALKVDAVLTKERKPIRLERAG